jgi:phosphatidylglycerol:prolipoprotein diacylglycerol transferase
MLPLHFEMFGLHLAIWDVLLIAGLIAGYFVLRAAFGAAAQLQRSVPRWLWLRYLVTAYVAVIAAQLFAYAFDSGTTLQAPARWSAAYYYLSPTAGPKTLYGAILALPLAVFLISTVPRDISFARALACWTPAMFVVLAIARVGCFLQGCCYGVRSDLLGIRFAEGSIVHSAQVAGGLIRPGAAALPVVPTQALEAVALAGLALWSFRAVRAGKRRIFVHAVAAYSFFRFAVEFLRADPARNQLGPLSTSQWIALVVVAASTAALVVLEYRLSVGASPSVPKAGRTPR